MTTQSPASKGVFLSHAASDRELAALLHRTLEASCTGLNVFVASRPGDIPTGENWFNEIETQLKGRQTYAVLLTPTSITRPWLWFEVGVAWASGAQIIPVCAGGLNKSEVPMPLAAKQVLDLADPDDAAQMLQDLSGQLADPVAFSAEIRQLGAAGAQRTNLAKIVAAEAARLLRSASNVEQTVVRLLLVRGQMTDRQLADELRSKGLGDFMAIGDSVATKTNLVERTVPGRQHGEQVTGYTGTFRINEQFREPLAQMPEALKP